MIGQYLLGLVTLSQPLGYQLISKFRFQFNCVLFEHLLSNNTLYRISVSKNQTSQKADMTTQ